MLRLGRQVVRDGGYLLPGVATWTPGARRRGVHDSARLVAGGGRRPASGRPRWGVWGQFRQCADKGVVELAGFNGKIELDVRDSEPDWAPFLAPQAKAGAPNVLMIAWDDVGYGTMECYGGPVKTPTMNRIADMGIRFSNFHTTALCSPTGPHC